MPKGGVRGGWSRGKRKSVRTTGGGARAGRNGDARDRRDGKPMEEGTARTYEPSGGDGVAHASKQRATRPSGATNGLSRNGLGGAATQEAVGATPAGALTPEQIRRIEQRLLKERETALRTLVGTRTDIQRSPIADMRKEALDIHLAERHSEFISLIDDALLRLRESPEDFHLSVVSGAPIPFERLEMVPWTRRLTSEMGLPAAR